MAAMNVKKIAELAQTSDLARAVFKTLAEMRKSRPTTDLFRFKERLSEEYGHVVNYHELLPIFKTLESHGLGKLVLSRDLSKKPHRFEWAYNNVEVGMAGTNVPSHVPLPRGPVQGGGSPVPPGLITSSLPRLTLSYPLRGHTFTIELPTDLTRGEADELCGFITRFGK
jgi:hypothetical protein